MLHDFGEMFDAWTGAGWDHLGKVVFFLTMAWYEYSLRSCSYPCAHLQRFDFHL